MTRLILLTLVLCFPAVAQTKAERKKAIEAWKADVLVRMDFEEESLALKVDTFKVQIGYTELIEIATFRGNERVVLAHRLSEVVYDDKGRKVVIVRSKSGKLRHPWQLKKGEFWVMHKDRMEHRATVEVKEVNDPPFSLPKAGKRE